MRIGTEGEFSRQLDLEAWAAQIAAMHLQVARMSPTSPANDAAASAAVDSAPAISAAEGLRARVLGARQGQLSAQDGVAYLQTAAEDLGRSMEVLMRTRAVASQALDGGYDAAQHEALQKYVDRSVQELEGIAEQARYHTLRMLGGTAAGWSLPEQAASGAPAAAEAATRAAGATGLPGQVAAGEAAAAWAAARSSSAAGHGVAPVVAPPLPAVPPSGRPAGVFGAASRPAQAPLPGQQVAAAAGPGAGAPLDADAAAPPRSAMRLPIGTPEQARTAVGRVDAAIDVLADVQRAVSDAHAGLLRTVEELGVDRLRFGGPGSPAGAGASREAEASGAALREARLTQASQHGASVLVDATRAQFQAVTTVLTGAVAAAAVSAQAASGPRDVSMAPRAAVEPVTVTARSARTATGREREGGRPDSAGSGVGRR